MKDQQKVERFGDKVSNRHGLLRGTTAFGADNSRRGRGDSREF